MVVRKLVRNLWRGLAAGRRDLDAEHRTNFKVAARVDMVRAEALAEAACGAMYDGRPHDAKDHFDDARFHFGAAIAAAERAQLFGEADRLRKRRDELGNIYRSQFRARS